MCWSNAHILYFLYFWQQILQLGHILCSILMNTIYNSQLNVSKLYTHVIFVLKAGGQTSKLLIHNPPLSEVKIINFNYHSRSNISPYTIVASIYIPTLEISLEFYVKHQIANYILFCHDWLFWQQILQFTIHSWMYQSCTHILYFNWRLEVKRQSFWSAAPLSEVKIMNYNHYSCSNISHTILHISTLSVPIP